MAVKTLSVRPSVARVFVTKRKNPQAYIHVPADVVSQPASHKRAYHAARYEEDGCSQRPNPGKLHLSQMDVIALYVCLVVEVED